MKTALILALTLATVAHAEIFQCSPGVFTDKPCENGTKSSIAEGPMKATIKINFVETTSHFIVNAPTLESVNAIFRAKTWSALNMSQPAMLEYEVKTTGKQCELSSATINLANNNHLPTWPYYPTAEPWAKRSWDNFYAGAVIHENGHRAIAREFTVFLREKLNGIGPKPCNELTTMLEQQKAQAWSQLRARQVAYDEQTQHGINQQDRR